MEDIARFYTFEGLYIGAFAGGAQPPAGSVEVMAPIDILPTEEQISVVVLSQRDELLKAAALRVAPLQDAVDIGNATEEESARLLQWKSYRIDLMRIEQQEGFPAAIDWPLSPDALSALVPVETPTE
ncbi:MULTISPECIES: tail fiber assembly protein [unclassified Pseudomonas]|uniref:tail fiber assembly protein n=1 Tax=unclassified Pseudomonas TaxID=196821 RepID=UPI001F5BC3EA|nr:MULTISPECIES: tail fiber assembly protein [unclassified Pseudomonas]